MDALSFFFSLAGVVMVVHWLVTNDRAGNRGKTGGFFAMREPEDIAAAEAAAAKTSIGARHAAKVAANAAVAKPGFTRR